MSDTECPDFLGIPCRGCSFSSYGCRFIHKMQGGEPLLTERQPHNLHHSNAIRVRTEDGKSVGFIGREYADEIAPWMDKGVVFLTVAAKRIGCMFTVNMYPLRSGKKAAEVEKEKEMEDA